MIELILMKEPKRESEKERENEGGGRPCLCTDQPN